MGAFEQFVVNATRIETCARRIFLKIGEYEAASAHVTYGTSTAPAGPLGTGRRTVAQSRRSSPRSCGNPNMGVSGCWNGGASSGACSTRGKSGPTAESFQLALDLCGVDRKLQRREALPSIQSRSFCRSSHLCKSLACDRLEKIDEFEKNAVILGVPIVLNKKVGILRRYQMGYESRFRAALRMLKQKTREPIESVEPSASFDERFPRRRSCLSNPEPEPGRGRSRRSFHRTIGRYEGLASEFQAKTWPLPGSAHAGEALKRFREAGGKPPSRGPMNRKQRKAAARRAGTSEGEMIDG